MWKSNFAFAAMSLCLLAGLAGMAGAESKLTGNGFVADGEAGDMVDTLCAACHSSAIVTQQRLSRPEWKKTLEWMVAEQGMPQLDPDDLALILDYLARHYGPNPNGPNGALTTPAPPGAQPGAPATLAPVQLAPPATPGL